MGLSKQGYKYLNWAYKYLNWGYKFFDWGYKCLNRGYKYLIEVISNHNGSYFTYSPNY